MLLSERSTSTTSPNDDNQWVGPGHRTPLEHHLEFAPIAQFDDKKVGLAIIKYRPRCIAVERHQNSLILAVPEGDLADRLRAAIDDLDARSQWHSHRLEARAPRHKATLEDRDHGRDARSCGRDDRLAVFSGHTVSRNRSP